MLFRSPVSYSWRPAEKVNTMVDRIVPAANEPGVLITEPFIQWVIEKDPIEKYLDGVAAFKPKLDPVKDEL